MKSIYMMTALNLSISPKKDHSASFCSQVSVEIHFMLKIRAKTASKP